MYSYEDRIRAVRLYIKLGHGELLLFIKDGTHGSQGLLHPAGRAGRRVRLHREVLQSDSTPFDHRLRQSGRV